MLRSSRVCWASLSQLINSLRRAPAYLRHAPPHVYITCDFERCQRHATLLVDASVDGEPPLTNGTYVLTSTSRDDVSFRQAKSVLFGLPFAHDASQAAHFADSVLSSAFSRNGMAIPFDSIQTIVIPELHPLAAHAVKELLVRLPQLRVACSPLVAAFLSDGDFFAGVKKALCENDARLSASSITFADVPQANLLPLEDGSSITALGGGRELVVASGDLTTTRERWRRERTNKLKHFESYALFLHDPVFYAMLVGPSAGVHFSWLPFIVHETDAGALLPLPDFFSSQKPSVSSLLEVWRVRDQVHRVETALQRFPETQRFLSTCYGEASDGAEAYIERLRQAMQKLEELRSRLGHRLATDTIRDMEKWSALLGEKIMKEVLFTQTPSDKTEEAVMDAYKRWASSAYLERLSRSLAFAGATLPPDALPNEVARQAPKSSSSTGVSMKTADGDSSLQFLKRQFEKHGMASLSAILEQEDIDLPIFLSMSPGDFQKVFKATFGLAKKLEILQRELRGSQQAGASGGK